MVLIFGHMQANAEVVLNEVVLSGEGHDDALGIDLGAGVSLTSDGGAAEDEAAYLGAPSGVHNQSEGCSRCNAR
jgi:hypothetical protein